MEDPCNNIQIGDTLPLTYKATSKTCLYVNWFFTSASFYSFYLSFTELIIVHCFRLSGLWWNILLEVSWTSVDFSRRQMKRRVFRVWIFLSDQWTPLIDLNGPQTKCIRKSPEPFWELPFENPPIIFGGLPKVGSPALEQQDFKLVWEFMRYKLLSIIHVF